MQRKLNDEFIKEYSEEFSEKASSEFFESSQNISGKQILTFTPSSQVNFFVLKTLFRKWQQEMKRLESPYFDYKNTDVRKAMVQFMNTLSQHIEVEREIFVAMLEEAVMETLVLATDPAGYLAMEFEALDVPQITAKMTKPILRYIKIHKEPIQEFFEDNEGVSLDDFLDNTEELEGVIDTEEAVKTELELLSKVLPISEDELFESDDFESEDDEEELLSVLPEEIDEESPSEEIIPEPKEITKEEEAEEVPESIETEQLDGSFGAEESYDESENETEEKLSEQSTFEPVDVDETVVEEPEAVIPEKEQLDTNDSSDQEEPTKKPKDTEDSSQEEVDDTELINQQFDENKPIVKDIYGEEEGNSLAEKLQNQKVQTIMEAISVNHRYMFTKELFDGDRDAFTEAITKIESCNSFDDAVEILVQNYAKERGWDMNGEEVKELLKVVFRKFR